VFGFAATLLVLDIALRPPGTPLQQLLHAWPGYLAYLASFLTIGGAWLLHTALTDHLARADSLFLRPNWTRTRDTRTCTHRHKRARSCRVRNGNSCPSSSGT
jgi:hypothetical protein